MRVLNLYYTATGNTQKVAERIDQTLRALSHEVDSVKVDKDTKVDVLAYDRVFVGSGVYAWLPGKAMQDLLEGLRDQYFKQGALKPGSPRIPKSAILYCTYGGVHTGVNEAIPAVKFMGQLFDHLGFEILDEWYFVGEYRPEGMAEMNRAGRLGDISERPDEADLREVEQKVRGIMRV